MRNIVMVIVGVMLLASCTTVSMDYDEALETGARIERLAKADVACDFDSKFAQYASQGIVEMSYDSLDRVYTVQPTLWYREINNGVYPYFTVSASEIAPRIHVTYSGDEWLFMDEVRVYNSTGQNWYIRDVYFLTSSTINENGTVSEKLDEIVNTRFMEYMLDVNAVRLIGDRTETVYPNAKEDEGMKAIANLYLSLLGK